MAKLIKVRITADKKRVISNNLEFSILATAAINNENVAIK